MQRTTTTFEVDDTGLEAVRNPRDDLLLEERTGPDTFTCVEGPFEHYERRLSVAPSAAGRHTVTETTDWQLAIPLWRPLFTPVMRRALVRRSVPAGQRAEPIEPAEPAGRAGLTDGSDAPDGCLPAPALPWWSPPARLDARASRILGLLCGLSLLVGYLGTVLTQTITFAADEFGASKSAQGVTLATVRFGVLLSLVLMAVSDRRGRRRLLVVSAVGGTVAAAAGALAPNLAFLGASQTASRAFSTALGLLIAVVAAEEMPAGARAYAASVLAMTAALGAGGAVILLPLADLGESAWRVVYVAPIFALPFFLKVSDLVPESRRFVRPHGRATLAGHRGRLALLGTSAFFGLMFLAPITQFQNDYLRDERGFSALLITIYTICTNTPGGIGIVVGGRLADVRGRRIVGAVGTVGGAAFLALTFQVSGPALWITSVLGTVIAATTVPALGVYGPELFPTALRGRANGWITLAGVCGSGVGLYLAGRLGDHYGRLGPGIAMLAVGPLIVTALVVLLFPETANVELEELNPEDAPALGVAPPVL